MVPRILVMLVRKSVVAQAEYFKSLCNQPFVWEDEVKMKVALKSNRTRQSKVGRVAVLSHLMDYTWEETYFTAFRYVRVNIHFIWWTDVSLASENMCPIFPFCLRRT